MQKRFVYAYFVGFVVSAFFAISFLITAIVSLLNPTLVIEMIKVNPYFSWMKPLTAYLVHISGNIIFTAIAIFFVLEFWRKYAK